MKILVLNGPNLNLLGMREPQIYGSGSFSDLLRLLEDTARKEQITVDQFQTNHEGCLVDAIQQAAGQYDGIVINPAAYTHTSVAILDALRAVGLPAVEVHISDISAREEFRRVSYTAPACCKSIVGQGLDGYVQAIRYLKQYLQTQTAGSRHAP